MKGPHVSPSTITIPVNADTYCHLVDFPMPAGDASASTQSKLQVLLFRSDKG